MNTLTIGILAGMGPRSTAPFVDLVVSECQRQYGATDDADFPHMMIYSLPTHFYVDRKIDHALLHDEVVAGLQKLESTGVAFIAMPCNSNHVFFDELAEAVEVPLLNMIEETLHALPESARCVAIAATPLTMDAGLYQNAVLGSGRQWVTTGEWQMSVNALIQMVKTTQDMSLPRAMFAELMAQAQQAGADSVIIACTDLNPAVGGYDGPVQLVDATQILAAATVKMWLTLRQEKESRL
jgi:aspartate racemase